MGSGTQILPIQGLSDDLGASVAFFLLFPRRGPKALCQGNQRLPDLVGTGWNRIQVHAVVNHVQRFQEGMEEDLVRA
jgi:hypothetical protein